jgi:hypothetical protein
MWLVRFCCVIASFFVNILFIKIKYGLFIIMLFFPTALAAAMRESEHALACCKQAGRMCMSAYLSAALPMPASLRP